MSMADAVKKKPASISGNLKPSMKPTSILERLKLDETQATIGEAMVTAFENGSNRR